MQLSLQTFSTMVQNAAAAAQNACSRTLDFATGGLLLAVTEANASLAMWVQWLILLVLQTTRAATSQGTDLDTWVADFALTRDPATSSTGTVTFSRFTNTQAAQIAPGVIVKTLDGTQSFAVIADTTKAIWNASLGVYVIPAGTTSGIVSAQAMVAGSAGNVLTGTIGLIASAIPYVDTVTNAAPFTGGLDPETDVALRARFQNYITTRARATVDAVNYAALSVQQGLTVLVQENTNGIPAYGAGNFLVTVNDGSGSPPSSLLSAVATAIDPYRPVGSTFNVVAPPITTATIVLTIASPSKTAAMQAAVQNAIIAFIQGLSLGASFPYSRIGAIAYACDSTITDVTAITLNGGTSDLSPSSSNGLIEASAATVTVN